MAGQFGQLGCIGDATTFLEQIGISPSDFAKRANEVRSDLLLPYQAYTTSVSTADMAASLEISVLLYVICEQLKPNRVLDLGSGFSSFALRAFAAQEPKTQIVSVDDNPEWLEKTRTFLGQHSLPTSELVALEDFWSSNEGSFDVIFHDIGNMHTRELLLPRVVELRTPKGLVILDDVHKRQYAVEVKRLLNQLNIGYFDLRKICTDRFRRYSWAIGDLSDRTKAG